MQQQLCVEGSTLSVQDVFTISFYKRTTIVALPTKQTSGEEERQGQYPFEADEDYFDMSVRVDSYAADSGAVSIRVKGNILTFAANNQVVGEYEAVLREGTILRVNRHEFDGNEIRVYGNGNDFDMVFEPLSAGAVTLINDGVITIR